MAVDDLIDRNAGPIGAFLVMGPTLIGCPYITGLLNPFWSSLFDFPLHLAAQGSHPEFMILAFLFWPLVMIAAMTWTATTLVTSDRPWRGPLILGWALSAFAVVPVESAAVQRFADWPLYIVD